VIKDFESVKNQLCELAPVINAFKSEAVQLRIVDLVFQGATVDNSTKRGATVRTRRRIQPGRSEPKKRTGSGKLGAVSILDQFIQEGYFSTKRTLSDIIQQASHNKAKQFKPNTLSGPLARFVRANKLKREKNENGQFAYFTS
jgi:hypothetical protein